MEINTYLYLLLKYYLETMRMYNDYLLEYLIVMKFNNRNIVNEVLRMWSNNIVNEIHLKKNIRVLVVHLRFKTIVRHRCAVTEIKTMQQKSNTIVSGQVQACIRT